jgi:hypothetical protein
MSQRYHVILHIPNGEEDGAWGTKESWDSEMHISYGLTRLEAVDLCVQFLGHEHYNEWADIVVIPAMVDWGGTHVAAILDEAKKLKKEID